jgi:hypothetical protein
MRYHQLYAGLFLLIGVGACGAPAGNNATGNGSTEANAPQADEAASANQGAAAGNAAAAAETPVGPCPFATRGWAAEVMPSTGSERPSVAMNGEIRTDRTGRQPMISTLAERRAPAYVIELISDPTVEPQADRGWMTNGGVFEDYDPAFTHVAVRCGDAEIARVPIRPSQLRTQ